MDVRPGVGGSQVGSEPYQRVDPHLGILALQPTHLVAGSGRKRTEVTELDADQVGFGGHEVHVHRE